MAQIVPGLDSWIPAQEGDRATRAFCLGWIPGFLDSWIPALHDRASAALAAQVIIAARAFCLGWIPGFQPKKATELPVHSAWVGFLDSCCLGWIPGFMLPWIPAQTDRGSHSKENYLPEESQQLRS